jgi:hypothetical protein
VPKGSTKEPPYWTKATVNNTGFLRIYFSEQLAVVTNLTAFNDKDILTVEIIPFDLEMRPFLNFTYSVVEFTSLYFSI